MGRLSGDHGARATAARRVSVVMAELFVVLTLLAGCAAAGPSSSSTAAPTTARGQASATASDPSISVVAAEGFYGELAQQIGGQYVSVYSMLNDPNADPHEYEPTVSDAKAIASAQVVVENGLGYDAFVNQLLTASPRPSRVVIDVGQLTGHKEGDNPHVWYDPATMPRVAQELASTFARLDPAHSGAFNANLQAFQTSEKVVNDEIAALKARYQGTKVLVTEPVFDYMAEALGLDVVDLNGAFPRAVEEGNDPPASAVADFRQQLTSRAVSALIVNGQTVTPITTQMQDLARQSGVPVVVVTETEPKGKNYQQWMLDQLQSLGKALGG